MTTQLTLKGVGRPYRTARMLATIFGVGLLLASCAPRSSQGPEGTDSQGTAGSTAIATYENRVVMVANLPFARRIVKLPTPGANHCSFCMPTSCRICLRRRRAFGPSMLRIVQ